MNFDSFSSKMVERGLDTAWLKMRVASDNIANYETPGYKAKQVSFKQVMNECSSPLHKGAKSQASYKAVVYTDENTEARVDGNNVSMEKEQLELWKAQAQYAYLTQKISGHYSNIRSVISQFGK